MIEQKKKISRWIRATNSDDYAVVIIIITEKNEMAMILKKDNVKYVN